jgi:hypothetical protein
MFITLIPSDGFKVPDSFTGTPVVHPSKDERNKALHVRKSSTSIYGTLAHIGKRIYWLVVCIVHSNKFPELSHNNASQAAARVSLAERRSQ